MLVSCNSCWIGRQVGGLGWESEKIVGESVNEVWREDRLSGQQHHCSNSNRHRLLKEDGVGREETSHDAGLCSVVVVVDVIQPPLIFFLLFRPKVDLERTLARCDESEVEIQELEDELKIVGQNMKTLELSETEALLRQEKYEETIRTLSCNLKVSRWVAAVGTTTRALRVNPNPNRRSGFDPQPDPTGKAPDLTRISWFELYFFGL